MWTTYCHVFEEDFQLIFMNHIRLLIRNQCGSHIMHELPNPLAFQQNYSCYDGPSESGIFSPLDEPLLTSYLLKMVKRCVLCIIIISVSWLRSSLQYWYSKLVLHTMAHAHYPDTGWIVLGQWHAHSKFCTGLLLAQHQATTYMILAM